MSNCTTSCPRGTPLLRWMLASAGVLSVGVGAVGAVVPGLPTTIFLLFACWCFARSCPWLERRLIRDNRLFAPFLVYLHSGTRMPRRARITALLLMWLAVSLSVVSLSRRLEASSFIPELIIVAAIIGSVVLLHFRKGDGEAGGEGVQRGKGVQELQESRQGKVLRELREWEVAQESR